MSADLQPNPRIEERLRVTFDAVIPHLADAPVSNRPAPERRPRLLGVAAACVIVLGGVMAWVASARSDRAVVTGATTDSATVPAESVAPAVSTPTVSTEPCLVEGCPPVDRLAIAAGAFDLFAGPESLGAPTVHEEVLDQLGILRCLALTSDGATCLKVEGIAGVAPIEYPESGVDVGTTYTSLSVAEYVAEWNVTGAGPSATTDVVIRGHAGLRYEYGDKDVVTWAERDGLLVWVAVPSALSDQLMTIAEGVRTMPGPTTMAYVVATGLGRPWDGSDNNGDGVVYTKVAGSLCVGIGWVAEPCSRIAAVPAQGSVGVLHVAGAGPSGAVTARVEAADGTVRDFPLAPVPGVTDAGFFIGEITTVDGSFTLRWLGADGAELAAEQITATTLVGVMVGS